MSAQASTAGRTAPRHIYAEVRGGGVIFPEGRKYVTVIGRDYQEPGSVQYLRADIARDLVAALEQTRAILSCIRDPEARQSRDEALTQIDAALAAAKTGGA